MLHAPKYLVVLATGIFLLLFNSAYAGLVVNPGAPQTVCKGDTAILGGTPTASGGTAPYSYAWSPTAGMNNPSDSNPHVLINKTTMFYVTVIDSKGSRIIDSVLISLNSVYTAGAGNDTSICPLTSGALLGNSNNQASYTYSWTPVGPTGLSCYNCPHPTATPTVTTSYTLTIQNGTCFDSSSVSVTVLATPTITVVSPVSVHEGSTVTLSASGAVKYVWTPDTAFIGSPNISNPEVDPSATITYSVTGIGADGCPGYAKVVVDVIPDTVLVFYNTFTPNGDGINDTWFIGNLHLYPNNSLTVFNRYGKQVYFAQPYSNLWDGTQLGSNLPDATYYYLLDTGKGTVYKGSVTIIRKPK